MGILDSFLRKKEEAKDRVAHTSNGSDIRISGAKKNLSTPVLHEFDGSLSAFRVDLVSSKDDPSTKMLQLQFGIPLGPRVRAAASLEVRPARIFQSLLPWNKVTGSCEVKFPEDDEAAYQPSPLTLSPSTYVSYPKPFTLCVPLSSAFFDGDDLSIYLVTSFDYHLLKSVITN